MVQYIERLRTEHQMEPFGAQRECFHHCWIHVDPRIRSEAISLDISVRSRRISLERCRVKFSLDVRGRGSCTPACPIEAEAGLRVIRGIGDAERLPCICHYQAAHCPQAGNRLQELAVTFQVW